MTKLLIVEIKFRV